MTDHADTLRRLAPFLEAHHIDPAKVLQAADAIDLLQAEITRLRAELAEAREKGQFW